MHNQPPFRRPLSVLTAFSLFSCFFDFQSALPVLRKLFLGGQTAPKTGMTLHSKNKMAPHPVKNSAKEPSFLGAVFSYAQNPASISRIPKRLTLLRSSGYTPPAPALRFSRLPSAPPIRFGRSTNCVPADPAPTGFRRPSADPKWDRENA